MIGIETNSGGTVPDRTTGPAGPGQGGPAHSALSRGPVAVLIAGVVLNVGWLVVLGWASFRTVRWLFA